MIVLRSLAFNIAFYVSLILQMISYFLYTLSYVPFGRRLLKKLCQCLFSDS